MKKLTRCIAALLAAALLLSASAFAADGGDLGRHPDALTKLMDCGFFIGTDKGLELDRSLTRSEATVLIVRVMGAAELPAVSMPFTDVADWAARYVSYLYNAGAVRGVSATRYGANEPVTGRQFYTMLLRVLGYDEARGDFAYETALDDAVRLGLLDAAEAARVQSTFLRDDAAWACWLALNAVPLGGDVPYALQRARDISNAYSAISAEVVTGTNRVYNALTDASRAVGALDSLTVRQKGVYRRGDTRSTVDTDVRFFPARGECYYLLDTEDRTGDTVTHARHAEAWSDGERAAIYSDGTWQPSENVQHFSDFYDRIFGADLAYATCFDYAEENGVIVLTGFSERFELLGDPTSSLGTNYYFDVTLCIDAETKLPLSAQCTYRDTWESLAGTEEVVYTSEFTFTDINSTVLPTETHGLAAALGR